MKKEKMKVEEKDEISRKIITFPMKEDPEFSTLDELQRWLIGACKIVKEGRFGVIDKGNIKWEKVGPGSIIIFRYSDETRDKYDKTVLVGEAIFADYLQPDPTKKLTGEDYYFPLIPSSIRLYVNPIPAKDLGLSKDVSGRGRAFLDESDYLKILSKNVKGGFIYSK